VIVPPALGFSVIMQTATDAALAASVAVAGAIIMITHDHDHALDLGWLRREPRHICRDPRDGLERVEGTRSLSLDAVLVPSI